MAMIDMNLETHLLKFVSFWHFSFVNGIEVKHANLGHSSGSRSGQDTKSRKSSLLIIVRSMQLFVGVSKRMVNQLIIMSMKRCTTSRVGRRYGFAHSSRARRSATLQLKGCYCHFRGGGRALPRWKWKRHALLWFFQRHTGDRNRKQYIARWKYLRMKIARKRKRGRLRDVPEWETSGEEIDDALGTHLAKIVAKIDCAYMH